MNGFQEWLERQAIGRLVHYQGRLAKVVAVQGQKVLKIVDTMPEDFASTARPRDGRVYNRAAGNARSVQGA
jgi:hypothetical protein